MAIIHIDFEKTIGKLKIMHSVNNVPVGNPVRKADYLSTHKYFEMAHIPYCRSHDASFCESYCGEFAVDVHRIFRDFDKDVNDESSYDFEYTDKYVKAAEDVGAHVFYRLGASIEHYKKKGTFPPKDYLKWARICGHIIRHYIDGWNNGFHYTMDYWEIWNEPDCQNSDGTNPCWQGTMEEFYDFFVVVYRHLKTTFPNLKIGGPALCNAHRDQINHDFFSRLNKENLVLDFFSFHGYNNDPKRFIEDADHAYECLKEFGVEDKTTLILNEWNYIRRWTGEGYIQSMHTIRNNKGASYIAGTMICGQKSRLEQMMYYDGKPGTWNGMFDAIFHTPLKGYYPFLIYGDMYTNTNEECLSSSSDDKVYCLAGKGENKYGIFITYFDDDDDAKDKDIEITIDNMKKDVLKSIEFKILDDDYDCQVFKNDTTSDSCFKTTLKTKPYTTYYITVSFI